VVQAANSVIKSDKYPECRERYRRIKASRGHKKAIIAVCRMLLTDIWNVLSKLEPYSAKGYLADKLTEHSVVISEAKGLELLRKRGYIFTNEAYSCFNLGSAPQARTAWNQCRDSEDVLK